jgi:hypothetical protein
MNSNPNNTIDTNVLRQIGFILIILVLGIVLLRELWFFLSAILGAITFYVLMRERQFYLVEKKGWKPATAAMYLWCFPSLSSWYPSDCWAIFFTPR